MAFPPTLAATPPPPTPAHAPRVDADAHAHAAELAGPPRPQPRHPTPTATSLRATCPGVCAGERIAYPMAYGYSLVGTVVGVGGGASVGLVGKLAFAFAPHAAAAFVDAAGLVVVALLAAGLVLAGPVIT